tara:strand:- start:234 stop:482 length:249 start_codon:yes stop_codon:yes gene_type:complete
VEEVSEEVLDLAREKDKCLRWRLLAFDFARGLRDLGENILQRRSSRDLECFIEGIDHILHLIKEDNMDGIHEFLNSTSTRIN